MDNRKNRFVGGPTVKGYKGRNEGENENKTAEETQSQAQNCRTVKGRKHNGSDGDRQIRGSNH